jgi:hypothetical protein
MKRPPPGRPPDGQDRADWLCGCQPPPDYVPAYARPVPLPFVEPLVA